jgi:hypothetical protein
MTRLPTTMRSGSPLLWPRRPTIRGRIYRRSLKSDDEKGNTLVSNVVQGRRPRRFHVQLLTRRLLPERGWWCKLADMPPTKVGKLAPVTLGHMRSQGCRDLLVYCNSGRCNHGAIMNVGHLPDDTPIKSLGDGIVCSRCGHLGADVVPNWPTHSAPR